jgi:nucleotide-binding universal stress UspA family protein
MKLLAILVGAESAPACLDAATLAARTMPDASVEALHVVVDPEKIIRASEEIEIQRMREAREGTAEHRAEAIHAAFVAWNAGADDVTPKVEWRAVVGAEEETVCREASAADVLVLVLAREGNLDSGDALHAAVFSASKPLLLVPANWRARHRLRFAHIAVALSDSEVARHAIAGAAQWLQAADRVTALRIGTEDDEAIGLIHSIEELGVRPELRLIERQGSDLGAQIVDEAKAIGADLIVAGAYRHNQFVEWLMGGTTRHLLAAADIPLLLTH